MNIDIVDIQINVTDNDNNGWQSLPNLKKGIYNLLDLVNDKDTLLVNAEIPAGRVQQIRLILGPNNSIRLNDGSSQLFANTERTTKWPQARTSISLVKLVSCIPC